MRILSGLLIGAAFTALFLCSTLWIGSALFALSMLCACIANELE